MPFSPAQWGRVRTAALGGDLPLLAWGHEEVVTEALLVAKRRGGFLLAVPAGAAEDSLRGAAAEGRFAGMLGPHFEVQVPTAASVAAGGTATVAVTFVDLAVSGRAELSFVAGVPDDAFMHVFEDDAAEACLPATGPLWAAARTWLDTAAPRPPRTGGYMMAESGSSGAETARAATASGRVAAQAAQVPPASAASAALEQPDLAAVLAEVRFLRGQLPTAAAASAPPAEASAGGPRLTSFGGGLGVRSGLGASANTQLLGSVPAPPPRRCGIPPPPPRLGDPMAEPGEDEGDEGLHGDEYGGALLPLDAAGDASDQALRRRLLMQTSAAVASMCRRPDAELRLLLGGSAAGGSESGGARSAAALEMERRRIESHPEESVATTRRLLADSLGSDPRAPQDALDFFMRFGTFEGNREAAMMTWVLGSLWNRLERREYSSAQALVGVSPAMIDQWGQSRRLDVGLTSRSLCGGFSIALRTKRAFARTRPWLPQRG